MSKPILPVHVTTTTTTRKTARIAAADFIELERRVRDGWGDTDADDYKGPRRISDVLPYPTLVFERGDIYVDEMWWIRNGNVGTSSFSFGVSSANHEGDQIRHYRFSETNLGKWLAIEFTPSSEIAEALGIAFAEAP